MAVKRTISVWRLLAVMAILLPVSGTARHTVYSPTVKTLQVTVNNNWLAPPVMALRGDVLNIGFDELSHTYHRYHCRLEHCEADWSPSEDIFESDWLEGFNIFTIDDYENSLNTTVLYTHYSLQIPNDRCRLKMSGNYKLYVCDEDNDDEEVLCVEFCVVEPVMNVGLSMTTNTDAGLNTHYQQIAMTVAYNGVNVTAPEQIHTVVLQNYQEADCRRDVKPTFVTPQGLKWEHCRELVFDGGNEYRKYETLALDHPTMGIDRMRWDGSHYHAFPFADEPRRHYSYDEDADGAFIVRNSDDIEIDRTCDYVYVHFLLQSLDQYDEADVVVSGNWANEQSVDYTMAYDPVARAYSASILQKQGYYNYRYTLRYPDGKTGAVLEEGNFYETENRYQALVYYKGSTSRTWRLVGYQEIKTRR